ncbi:hypothetical protein SAMN02745134_00137 [Clostridium acidisoli DSM 12555]|uniref:Uncharacterized protein n=1 Tax=Clostridium acidisoli DSM 12555 TaxID=1121291 RepID=A0A1W1WZX2_9CLOT|nr:hypothetical protein [Clostridium acidisoli]SMC16691.1 hypothetical protein SAMN02745134_00137 [Clostridium acidisoli DSM 12555]
MDNASVKAKDDKTLLYLTIPIVILIATCSSIGIWHEQLYFKETVDWLSQCIGQDISNLFFVSPILLASAFYSSKGNKIAKIIWIGTIITNIYSYIIYCFAVHFNFLFHIYCSILGLSIFSGIIFFTKYINEDFKNWFTQKVPTKTFGFFLFTIASMFTALWLFDSLPSVLTNAVPENIIKDNLLTNPVQALDFSFYLPLMFISSVMLIKKKSLGYLIAPMMMVFAILTNINIICLMFVTMKKTFSNNTPVIIIFCIFTFICICFLCSLLKNISERSRF